MYRFWGGQIWCGGEGGPENFYETYIFALGLGLRIKFLKRRKNINKWKSGFFENCPPRAWGR